MKIFQEHGNLNATFLQCYLLTIGENVNNNYTEKVETLIINN